VSFRIRSLAASLPCYDEKNEEKKKEKGMEGRGEGGFVVAGRRILIKSVATN
jgi:hypothetical protein